MKAIQAGRWSWQAWACLWGGAWVGAAAGQSAGWEQLKRGHEAEVAEAARPLREGFRKALQTLEGQLAGRGDYAGAQRVQAERRQRLAPWPCV